MKHLLLTLLVFFTLNTAVQANNSTLSEPVRSLQHEWAVINYQVKDKKKKLTRFNGLAAKAKLATEKSPNSAETKIWYAIILSTQAGVKGGMGALKLVKKAKNLLLEAEKIDATALNGSAYTSLGSLYYKVPGWPIGFGSKNKAHAYLKKALKLNPQGIDPNFFYGELLMEEDKYQPAIKFLKVALGAAARPDRPIADKGRRQEAQKLLQKAEAAVK